MKARADWVLAAYQFIGFQAEYETVYLEMNRKDR